MLTSIYFAEKNWQKKKWISFNEKPLSFHFEMIILFYGILKISKKSDSKLAMQISNRL